MSANRLRPKDAARRYSVSRQTLGAWADRGWVRRTRVGKCTWLDADDIQAVLDAHTSAPQAAPVAAAPPASDDWRADPLWAGTVVAAAPARATRGGDIA